MFDKITAALIAAAVALGLVASRDAQRRTHNSVSEMRPEAVRTAALNKQSAPPVSPPPTAQPAPRGGIDPGMVVSRPEPIDNGMIVQSPFAGDPGIVANAPREQTPPEPKQ